MIFQTFLQFFHAGERELLVKNYSSLTVADVSAICILAVGLFQLTNNLPTSLRERTFFN